MLKTTLCLLFAALAVSASAADSAATALTDQSPPTKVVAKRVRAPAAARAIPPAHGDIIGVGKAAKVCVGKVAGGNETRV